MDSIQIAVGQIIRGMGMNKEYSIASCILSFVNMCGIIVCVYFGKKGLPGALFSMVIAQTVSTLYMLIKGSVCQFVDRTSLSTNKIKELLAYSWPMVPNNLSGWVLSLSDRLVISTFLGLESNAIYAIANKIPSILSVGQAVLVMAWQENASIAVSDKDADEYFSRMLSRTFRLMIGFTAILIAAIPFIFKLLIKGDYFEAYYQMPILILSMFFYVMSSFYGGIYIAHKRTVKVGITTIIAAAINFLIDILFVNRIGIWAGSISTLVAYVFLYFYRLVDSQKFQNIQFNLLKQIGMIVLIILMLILCFQNNKILNTVNIVIGIVIAIMFNLDIVRVLLYKAKMCLTK